MNSRFRINGTNFDYMNKKTSILNHFVNVYSSYHCFSMDEVFLKIDNFNVFCPKIQNFGGVSQPLKVF